MKHFLAALLFATFLPSVALHATCEDEASPTPKIVSRYMALVEIGLSRKIFTPEDVRKTLALRRATSPMPPGRSLDTLSLRHGFSSVVQKIKIKDWRLVQAKLRARINEELKRTTQIDEAKAETEYIFTWKHAGLRTDGPILANLVSKSGDIVIVARTQNATDIFVGSRRSQIPIEFDEATDIFEMSTGQVVVSTVVGEFLNIYDARTGDLITERSIEKLKSNNLWSMSAWKRWRTVLYEAPNAKGELMVAVLPHQDDAVKGDIPLFIYNVTGKKIARETTMPSFLTLSRFRDGHVYIYGKDGGRNRRGTQLIIQDVSTDTVIYREFFKGTHSLSAMTPVLVLNDQGQPEMYLIANFNKSLIFYLDQAKRDINPLKNLGGTFDAEVFNDQFGRTTSFSFRAIDDNSAELLLRPLDPGQSEQRIIVPAALESCNFVALATSPKGNLFIAIDYLSAPEEPTLKILNLKTEIIESIPLRVRTIHRLFVNPTNDKIYAFEGDDEKPRQLYQLWGPPQ